MFELAITYKEASMLNLALMKRLSSLGDASVEAIRAKDYETFDMLNRAIIEVSTLRNRVTDILDAKEL